MTPHTPPLLPSYKSLVAEALRQLVGEERFQQDEVLPPGYCTGENSAPFGISGGWAVLNRTSVAPAWAAPSDIGDLSWAEAHPLKNF